MWAPGQKTFLIWISGLYCIKLLSMGLSDKRFLIRCERTLEIRRGKDRGRDNTDGARVAFNLEGVEAKYHIVHNFVWEFVLEY